MRRLVALLLLGAFCQEALGCGGAGGGAQETQCTRTESYTANEAYETCTGWWIFEDCSTAYRVVTVYHVVGFCHTGYTKSGTTCYRNGGWSGWSAYSHCTASTSTCTRTRSCTSPSPGTHGAPCSGSGTQSQTCSGSVCPVDGGWTQWTDWTRCSSLEGTCSRTRACTSPAPARGGSACSGASTQTETCSGNVCPVDGGWTDWNDWSHCDTDDDGTTCIRQRSCTSPTPANGGAACGGANQEAEVCGGDVCPVDGGWTEFTEWSHCDSLEGACSRSRTCTNPNPLLGGAACEGAADETETCSGTVCPVDGGWTEFTPWGHCSSVDDGTTCQRSRSCSSPTPAQSGADCLGPEAETAACGGEVCPVDGGWTEFTEWSHCDSLEGACSRSRTCTNPSPLLGGAACEGAADETETCSGTVCPVDGGWTEWSVWTHCSTVDDGSTCSRSRTCTSPAPANGGLPCDGPTDMTADCGSPVCPVDGAWTAWSEWTECAPNVQTCAATRCCSAPLPRNTGATCEGQAVKSSLCTGGLCVAAEVERGGSGFGGDGDGGETQGGGGGSSPGGGSFGRK